MLVGKNYKKKPSAVQLLGNHLVKDGHRWIAKRIHEAAAPWMGPWRSKVILVKCQLLVCCSPRGQFLSSTSVDYYHKSWGIVQMYTAVKHKKWHTAGMSLLKARGCKQPWQNSLLDSLPSTSVSWVVWSKLKCWSSIERSRRRCPVSIMSRES